MFRHELCVIRLPPPPQSKLLWRADNDCVFRTKTGGSFARTGVPPAVASTAYNAANHQTTFDNKTLTYDNNGNLQTIIDPSGTMTYTWNARNQLAGISGPGMSASFVYDGLGRREKKTINGNLTEFLYDGLNPVQETSGATIIANILPGLGIDEFLARTDVVAGVTSHFLTDALGSPVAVTNNAGTVQTEYTYEPFGKTTFTGSSNSSSYQYTGRENDGTALFYYRNRYYHPQLQRFISEDPIEFKSGDFNLFAYVMNKPTNYTDPLGLDHADRLGRCLVLAGCVDRNGKPKTKTDPPPQPPRQPIPTDPCRFGGCFIQDGTVYTPDYEPIDPFQSMPESPLDTLGYSWSWFWQQWTTKGLKTDVW